MRDLAGTSFGLQIGRGGGHDMIPSCGVAMLEITPAQAKWVIYGAALGSVRGASAPHKILVVHTHSRQAKTTTRRGFPA